MKLDFHAPMIEDKEEFDNILKGNQEFSSEYAFGTSYLWKDAYDIQICICDDIIFKKYSGEYEGYSFPYSQTNVDKALDIIINYAKDTDTEVKFLGVTEDRVKELQKLIPGKFKFDEDRDSWDYVYYKKDLAELKGRKYHQKRNHISKFIKLYRAEYENITNDNINHCKEISDKWFKEKNENISQERISLEKAFSNYEELGLFGGILKVESVPVAFTIGERINDDVFLVHFEKALSHIEGAYNVINNEFCKRLNGYKYINREEDLGIPGLRRAKTSYRPAMMIKKYTAVMEG